MNPLKKPLYLEIEKLVDKIANFDIVRRDTKYDFIMKYDKRRRSRLARIVARKWLLMSELNSDPKPKAYRLKTAAEFRAIARSK